MNIQLPSFHQAKKQLVHVQNLFKVVA